MSELGRELLRSTGGYAPAEDRWERILRLAARRQRNRRIGSALVAVAIFAGTDLALLRSFAPAAPHPAPAGGNVISDTSTDGSVPPATGGVAGDGSSAKAAQLTHPPAYYFGHVGDDLGGPSAPGGSGQANGGGPNSGPASGGSHAGQGTAGHSGGGTPSVPPPGKGHGGGGTGAGGSGPPQRHHRPAPCAPGGSSAAGIPAPPGTGSGCPSPGGPPGANGNGSGARGASWVHLADRRDRVGSALLGGRRRPCLPRGFSPAPAD